ncbi:MAG TPA: oxidoreductase [Piscinibacter sp.]|nr:oxidoreductase [Piscinibacter sp.]HPG77936.1 oxidoreductase [Piscinibacter sp.]HPM65425.1 oxidoreductase [Piscinibacter sp.]
MPPPALRVGLIGYGYAGRTFHAPLIAGVPGLELAAVSSRDAARVHADWPAVEVLADAHSLIARADLDLVVIASPNDSHHPLAHAALMAGRNVVVDKPFTLTLAQARELAALAQARGRLLSVFHNRRWDGDFLTLRALVEQGELGRIVHLESAFDRYRPVVRDRWRESAEPGAGLWFDLGPHLLDQALQLFGTPQAIALDQAVLRDSGRCDDWFQARLCYPGRRVVLRASMLAAAASPRFVVHGTRGSWVKQGLDPQEEALKAGARPTWPAAPGWGADRQPSLLTRAGADALRTEPLPLCCGGHGAFYAALRDALQGLGDNPVPASQACAVMAWLELGQRSAREGRECGAEAPEGLDTSGIAPG